MIFSILTIIVCVLLVLVILVQNSKGGGIQSQFGAGLFSIILSINAKFLSFLFKADS